MSIIFLVALSRDNNKEDDYIVMAPLPREGSKQVVDYRQTFSTQDIGYQAQNKCVKVIWNAAVKLECK